MSVLFAARRCVRVDVVWYTNIYTWHGGPFTRQRVIGDTLRVDL